MIPLRFSAFSAPLWLYTKFTAETQRAQRESVAGNC